MWGVLKENFTYPAEDAQQEAMSGTPRETG